MSTTIVGKSTECYMLYDVKEDYLNSTYAGSYGFVLGELENCLGAVNERGRLQDGSLKIVKVACTVVEDSD